MKDSPFLDYRWGLLGALGSIVYLIAFVSGYNPLSSGGDVLGTLARVQAAIFAIVFSVVILGVQLSASRYSPRLASTFKSDSGYLWTVGVFGISIAFNIAGLYLMNAVPSEVFLGILVASGVMAVGAFWVLFDFVSETLEKTTPEGILEEIKNNLEPSYISEQAKEAADDVGNRDPFVTLLNVILSAISQGDRDAASHGLSILSDRVSALLRDVSDDEFEEESPLDESLEGVCTERMPGVAEEALDNGMTQTALEVVEATEDIGETAVEQDLDRVVEHVVRGQSIIVSDLGYGDSEERVRSSAMDSASTVLKLASKEGPWTGGARATRLLGWRAAASIMDRGEGSYNRRYTSLLILCFPKLVSNVLDVGGGLDDHAPNMWLRAFILDDFASREQFLNSCYGSMAELTSAAIRYELRTGDRIVDWQSVAYGWTEAFQALEDTELVSLRHLWFGTILYLEYIREVSPDSVMDDFNPQASYHIDPDEGVAVVDNILHDGIQVRAEVDHIPGYFSPLETPLTGKRSPPVTDPEIDFSEWLERQREFLRMNRRAGFIDGEEDSE